MDADHRHVKQAISRDGLATDFRQLDRERFELARSLLGQQTSAAKVRRSEASLIMLAGILLAWLTIGLYFQAIEIHSQSSFLRLIDSLLVLFGLISAFFCLYFALRVFLQGRDPQAGSPAAPNATVFFDPAAAPSGVSVFDDPAAFSRAFLTSNRRQLLDGAVQALFLESRGAAVQRSNLRIAAITLLVSFGVLLIMVLLAVVG